GLGGGHQHPFAVERTAAQQDLLAAIGTGFGSGRPGRKLGATRRADPVQPSDGGVSFYATTTHPPSPALANLDRRAAFPQRKMVLIRSHRSPIFEAGNNLWRNQGESAAI